MIFIKKSAAKIIQIKAESPYFVYATLQNGQEIKFDLMLLTEKREAFWRLKNFRYFRNYAKSN